MDLTGMLLIAMPGMGDPRFAHAVVLVCAHSAQGAMGLVVNKPAAPGVGWAVLAEQLGLAVEAGVTGAGVSVQFGGPVEPGRGFVLHSPDWPLDRPPLPQVVPGVVLTSTRDILEDIAAGRGPERALLALGYAGWGPGQLEAEIGANGWLTGAGDAELVLGVANLKKWDAALRRLGVDPLSLSAAAGRA
ncbi:YqgE/AlgH family protein [Phaeovulum sp.]|uniref:YqgE/AlgH family protein n=1 Tax=Phaeovulum sp. TaxID=2934796 RepID=UPI00272F3005|nr:YqgE/AlgH family protein [Phaeovulum sp.]MDP1669301.1 YqgE/AlgH family protein [Phaeovulum sp.]MDZ4119577.1 YqgE/AlgH family protein [Phaeovulum sp.]